MDIALILSKKYPNTLWALDGSDYSDLVWKSDTTKPTKKELEALWPGVKSESEREKVEILRASAYRQSADPLFFQYQRGEATEQEWLNAVQSVKDLYPYN